MDLQICLFRHTQYNPRNTAHITTTWRDTVYRINHGNQVINMPFFHIPWLAPSHHLHLSSSGITRERLFLIIHSEAVLFSHTLSYYVVLLQSFTYDYFKKFLFLYFIAYFLPLWNVCFITAETFLFCVLWLSVSSTQNSA